MTTTNETQTLLSTGVVLRSRPISLHLLQDILRQASSNPPQPPMRYDEDRDRHVPDEDDPAYRAAIGAHFAAVASRLVDIALVHTTLVSIPDGVLAPDDPAWAEMQDALGIPVETNATRRYLAWCKYVAAPDEADVVLLLNPLLERIGVPVAAVLPDAEVGTEPEPEPVAVTPAA